ncbi:MAG: hypothetical protein O7C56_01800, partial [Rickettsia endosymbiont of Ixodes persulcatus]|nr:hypothetical protein [Rickettsia endosymbiont of Ixodes persulcatus]
KMKSIYVRLIIAVLFSIGTMNFINTNPNIFNSMLGTVGIIVAELIDVILAGSAIASLILKYKK